jgi:putative Mn2+ efflux pump MntP
MSPGLLFAVAVGLAMDAFATAIAVSVSLRSVSRGQVFRLAWHFGLFQAMMPVIGWLAGLTVVGWIEVWDHWIAFGLLAFVGGRSVVSGLRDRPQDDPGSFDPTRGVNLVVLSIATSLDALAVGLSFAALGVQVWVPSLIIGCVAGAMTVVGMMAGGVLGRRFGRGAETIGGIVLISIGVLIVAEHLGR